MDHYSLGPHILKHHLDKYAEFLEIEEFPGNFYMVPRSLRISNTLRLCSGSDEELVQGVRVLHFETVSNVYL